MEKKIRKLKAKKHIVVFQDAHGKVFKTVFVNDGESAQPPEMESVQFETKHHQIVFAGWDQDISSVRSNLVVHPIYREQPREFLVMYFHEDGKILGTETVPCGRKARADYHPVKEETEEYVYHFAGWSCDVESVDSDRMAKAVFRAERKRFPVRFYDDRGNLYQEQMVPYGESAVEPRPVHKEDDPTYYYHFDGWDTSFDRIKAALDVRPLFREEYKQYRIRLFEEDRLIGEKMYHYNDPVEYPVMSRKGYDFIWKDPVERVEKTMEIIGFWVFSNPGGRKIRTREGFFEIMNPSTTEGTVRLLEYYSTSDEVLIPGRIKLGDYYYKIEAVCQKAFTGCPNLRRLVCSDEIRSLEERCFASNARLEEIVIGRNVRYIGKEVFGNCHRLKTLIFKSDRRLKIDRRAFEKANSRLTCLVPSTLRSGYARLLDRVVREKNMKISEIRS